MRNRSFGWTREPVSVLGQGTWNMEQGPRDEALRALRAGLDAGMSLLDTAEMYGSGAVEELVGEAIAGRRDEVFVVTKVLPENASRRGTVAACERSLRRLRVEQIDLYLLHWPGPHPLDDTIAAFEELAQKGSIRWWGLSNFDAEGLDHARAIAGPRGIACDQVLYHTAQRAIEHEVLPWCQRHEVPLMAYSPFGSGTFPAPASRGGRALAAIAKARGATPRQVALAFLLRKRSYDGPASGTQPRAPAEPIVFAIPKASNVAHVTENAAAAEIVLTPAEITRLEAAFPLGKWPAVLPTL